MHVRDSSTKTNTIAPGYNTILKVVTLLSCYVRCKKLCDAEKKQKIVHTSNVIIISLKRYSYYYIYSYIQHNM